MENVHPDKEFVFRSGKSAKNIWDLRKALYSMAEDEYSNHATANKNDFADWVEFVVLDKQLANKLRNATSREAAAEVIDTKVKQLTVELGKSHIVSDFDLIKDFIIGLIVGLVVGAAFGYFVLAA